MKKINTTILCIAIIVGIGCNNALSQYALPEKTKCETLKSRTLAVRLFTDANGEYTAYNDAIKKAYNEEWKITAVEFFSPKDYADLVKEGNTKYAVVYAGDALSTRTLERVKGSEIIHSKEFRFAHFDVTLANITGADALDPVTVVSFANDDLLPSEFFFAAQQLVLLVNASLNDVTGLTFYDHEKNIEYIKSKKLAVPDELFNEKDLAKIADKYEFPNKVVTNKELNDLVLAKNEEYVYPKIIWSNMHSAYGWVMISAKDGSLRSFMSFGGIKTNSEQKANEVLKTGQLKNALSSFMQKVNNRYK